ncbi:MAG TPA: hypothetical protein VFG09_11200 [Thermodesulfovibrionales bacterium]|jgi:hypothetical protein|nr:hypothetical protein [Thermodesulfovibrionales bacterium]
MFSEEMVKSMMDLFGNPLFKKGFFDFFLKMQQEGIEAAKKFWSLYPDKSGLSPNIQEIYEKMVDFYIVLGFVPRAKFDDVLRENERLRSENSFLKEMIKQFQMNLSREGGKKMQEEWQAIIDKQMEMNKEMAKGFFEFFRELKGSGS